MKVTIRNKEYKIDFQHTIYPKEKGAKTVKMSDYKNPKQSQTMCSITENGKYLTEAIVKVSKSDNFNKSTGRKLSLKKALKTTNVFTKEERTYIWAKYFEMHNK